MLRQVFGRPMVVGSCCRSAAHNIAIDGHQRSLHVYDTPHHPTGGCCAIDIDCGRDGDYVRDLVRCAINEGWSFGIGRARNRDTFVHLDRRDLVGLPAAAFGY